MDDATTIVATILRYVGAGAFVNGVPARDLTTADVEQSNYSAEQLLAFTPRVYAPVLAANSGNAPKRAIRINDSGASGNLPTEIKHD